MNNKLKSAIGVGRSTAEAVDEQSGCTQDGQSDNNRFDVFPVSVSVWTRSLFRSLLIPQFSHRSPIVLPLQKGNWGGTMGEGWTKHRRNSNE